MDTADSVADADSFCSDCMTGLRIYSLADIVKTVEKSDFGQTGRILREF